MTRYRSIRTILAVALFSITLPSLAAAQDFKVGIRGGYYTKLDKPFLGGEFLARVAPRFWFNPNVEYVFVNSGSYVTFNGDFHYDFPTHSDTFLWLGAGPALVRSHPDGFPVSTDVAANLFGGLGFRTGTRVIPYIQAKAIIKSDSLASLAVGLRF